jgi:tetrahydromethanopterin:alpha-L-glutamate ligase
MTLRIAILTDLPGWHGRELQRALRAFGADSAFASLSDCRLDLEGAQARVRVPGFDAALPDAVFVRSIEAGSFEQVTLRLSILHALRELQVPVYNDARAIERSVDKAMTTFLLRRHGIPTLPTWVTEQESTARAVVMRESAQRHELVVKPLFGSQGKGLQRLDAGARLPAPEAVDGVWYLQRFLNSGEGNWHDWRVMVAGGRPVAAMLRRGSTWVTNVARGAQVEAVAAEGALADLAIAATAAVGADYAGVDLMRDADGRFLVLEVNSIPAWRGLQAVTPARIADALAADLVDRVLLGRAGGAERAARAALRQAR